MKFLNGKKNSYIFDESKGGNVGQFKNGVFETNDEEIIRLIKDRFKIDGVVDVEFTEIEAVVVDKVVETVDNDDEEDELPDVKETIVPSKTNIKKMNQGELKLEMDKYGLSFKIGMKNDDIRAMILKARKG